MRPARLGQRAEEEPLGLTSPQHERPLIPENPRGAFRQLRNILLGEVVSRAKG